MSQRRRLARESPGAFYGQGQMVFAEGAVGLLDPFAGVSYTTPRHRIGGHNGEQNL